jgi:hypothetical protein
MLSAPDFAPALSFAPLPFPPMMSSMASLPVSSAWMSSPPIPLPAEVPDVETSTHTALPSHTSPALLSLVHPSSGSSILSRRQPPPNRDNNNNDPLLDELSAPASASTTVLAINSREPSPSSAKRMFIELPSRRRHEGGLNRRIQNVQTIAERRRKIASKAVTQAESTKSALDNLSNLSAQQRYAILAAQQRVHKLQDALRQSQDVIADREASIAALQDQESKMQDALHNYCGTLNNLTHNLDDKDRAAQMTNAQLAQLEACAKADRDRIEMLLASSAKRESKWRAAVKAERQCALDKQSALELALESEHKRLAEREAELQSTLELEQQQGLQQEAKLQAMLESNRQEWEQERERMSATRESELIVERIATKRAMDVSLEPFSCLTIDSPTAIGAI